MGKIMNTMPQTGEVVWIGVRPKKRADMTVLNKVKAKFDTGLDGDRYDKDGNLDREYKSLSFAAREMNGNKNYFFFREALPYT